MKFVIFIITCFGTLFVNGQIKNIAPSIPATDEYHGIKVVDEYRNLEDLKDPATINWMKSQTDYTNSVLSQIPKKNFYLEKRLELDKRQGYLISNLKIVGNDKYFYLKKAGNEKIAKLYCRNGFGGDEELLYDPARYRDSEQKHDFIINYISPSWDGTKVAISLAEKGKELSEVIIMDIKKKYIYPETITNIEPVSGGGMKWLDDNSGFFYMYYTVTDPTSKDFYKNTRTVLYKIGTDPKKVIDVFSANNNPDLNIAEDQFPMILDFDIEDQYYIGMLVDFNYYRKTYIIRKEDLLKGKKNWKPFSLPEDKVRNLQIIDNESVLFLSGIDASVNKLCKTNISNPNFKNPEVLVSEKKGEALKSYRFIKDGIYYTTTKNGVEAKLYSYKNGKDESIKLPYPSGTLNLQSNSRESANLWITCSGWANEEQRFLYNSKDNSFKPENLTPIIEYPEFKDIIVNEILVKARDGEEIPVSLIYHKNIKKDGRNPLLIDSYGSYGISNSPSFSKTFLLWVNQGGMVAVAHVRGGGEKGDKWHKAGFKETKPNTWRDLIDCTEYLIKEKYTSKDKIAIWGTSAGGITVGRAMTERPDLFKAVIAEVGVMNPLRDETTPNAQPKEFGTIKDSKEFKALLEMDAYQHIEKNVKYPATFITGGINDQRVIVWEPTKFAAKLMADNISKNPVLLKIDYDGGHAGNVPIAQRYANLSDMFAFALWQLGHPDYQPKKAVKK